MVDNLLDLEKLLKLTNTKFSFFDSHQFHADRLAKFSEIKELWFSNFYSK